MKRLPYQVVRQGDQTLWCWAAVAAGVWSFFRRPGAVSMCEVVSFIRDEPCCPPIPAHCHTERELDVVLRQLRLLRAPLEPGPIPLRAGGGGPSIEEEISQGRPVGVGLSFGTFAHFCVVYGSDALAGRVAVADSLFDNVPAIPYVALRDNYRNSARWVATYLTKHPGAGPL